MQNHSSAKQMKFSFSAGGDAGWKSVTFDVVPQDKQVRVYRIALNKIVDWKGTIDQIRLEPGAGEIVTGTMRVDYIRLLERKK